MEAVSVIDYGMGNLRSVAKALERARPGVTVNVTNDPKLIDRAERVVFPGVGALRDCMAEIQQLRLDEVIREAARHKPFLGICLGMQALLESSEENGGTPGLGIIPGQVVAFAHTLRGASHSERLKVPHVGWNEVHQTRPHPLWKGIPPKARFYFVHSYYVAPAVAGDVAATCCYGREFVAALSHANVFAVQFHPEKSQLTGLTLLANFMVWDGRI